MAALSWRKWADPVVDFGMQLYTPWRLSQGDILYRNVMYLPGGPLSQYFNALLFRIFGVSFRTLIFANLTITAVMLVVIYRGFLRAADRWTATTIASAIVAGFAFANYGNGNYNYITPYCHEAFHGLVLSILAIALLSDWLQKKCWPLALGAGLCCGLVFLTKPEVFLALGAGVLAAFVVRFREGGPVAFILKSLAAFVAAALAAPLGFFLYFLRHEDGLTSLHSVAFAWLPLLETSVAHNAYYDWCLGLDHPLANLWRMVEQFVAITVVIALCAAFFRRRIASSRDRITALVIGAALLALVSGMDWTADYFLPLTSLTLCVLLCVNFQKLAVENRLNFPLLWSVFGLVLLAKMGLFSRIWHYGFVLGMPAFVGTIYLLLWLLPRLLTRHGVQLLPFRRLVWCVIVFVCLQLLVQSAIHYHRITFAIGSGGDEIKTADTERDQRGLAIAAAISWLKANVSPRATLAVLPEGALINYLTRRINPTGYPVWLPPEMEAFGQARMTAAFERHSPDYTMLVQRSYRRYEVKDFGQQSGNGKELMRWIRANYRPVYLIGHEPFSSGLFGVEILKRLPPGAVRNAGNFVLQKSAPAR